MTLTCFYKLHTGTKQRMGMAAYYAKAWHLWFSYPMTRFVAEYGQASSAEAYRADVTELMAVRIRNFGGVLQELAPGASLDRDDLRVVLCRTANRLAYLAYVTRGLLRLRTNIPGINLANSTSVSCTYRDPSHESSNQRKIYVEADGESGHAPRANYGRTECSDIACAVALISRSRTITLRLGSIPSRQN